MAPGPLLEQFQLSTSTTSTDTDCESERPSTSASATSNFPESDILTLHRAAMMLRAELQNSSNPFREKWPPLAEELDIPTAESMIPVALYNKFAWMMGVSDEITLERFVKTERSVHLKLLSLLQDVVYMESRGQKATPKHYCLGMMLHHISGSSTIVSILNKLGHCTSRLTISALETALAQVQASASDTHIPAGFVSEYTTVVWDNIDFNKETVSGQGTTHHTNGIIVQKAVSLPLQIDQPERITLQKRQHVVVSEPVRITPYQKRQRTRPVFGARDTDVPSSAEYAIAHRTAMKSYLLYAFVKHFDEKGHISPWTGFKTSLHANDVLLQDKIGYLPMIPASPTSYDTVFTILKRSIGIADKLELPSITIVFDMAIYLKAQDIRWADKKLFDRTGIRLGEFHTCMNFLGVIGKRFRDAGLYDLVIKAEVVAIGSVNAVLEGKQYNRAIAAHKVVVEAMEHLRFEAFLGSLPESKKTELRKLAQTMLFVFPSPGFVDMAAGRDFQQFVDEYSHFCAEQSFLSPTFSFWQSYVEMISVLLHFIRCTRCSDWEGHLSTLDLMAPWFFAYDHVNYSRYVPVYLKEMRELKQTHPFAYERVKNGEFTIQQQDRYAYSATAADQVIEQTINKDSKSAGGIVGITMRPNAVTKWILSHSQRLAMTQLCKTYAGEGQTVRHRKDLDPTRRVHDAMRVERVVNLVKTVMDPFSCGGSELVNIHSGAVASTSCEEDLLQAFKSGQKAQQDFIVQVTSDPKALHSAIKRKNLSTFKSCVAKNQKDKKGVDLTHRRLFARMVILMKQGTVQLKEVLTYCLGPVSYPLASADGSLAKTAKSAIVGIVEKMWPLQQQQMYLLVVP